MSISSTSRKAGPYTGNGVTTVLPFSFKVFSSSDVRVVRTDLAGVESDLTLTTHYAVSLNADQDSNPGGTITLVTAAATGFLTTITSQVDGLQPVVLTNAGGFYPTVINTALDRLTILVQQVAEKVGRALTVDISSGLNPASVIASIFSSEENAVAAASAASASAAAAAASASSIDLPAAITAERTAVATLTNKTLVAPALGTPASGNLANCTFPTLNQNTSGTAANLSGTPALPNGTTATTQTAGDNSTKLATTAYVATAAAAVSSPIKAWVTFNGSGTILASFNVASVTRNSTGVYTIAFSSAMADANYAAVVSARRATSDSNLDATLGSPGNQYDANGFSMTTRNSTAMTLEDAAIVCVHVCR